MDIQRILCPIDLSEDADRTEVHLLHVLNFPLAQAEFTWVGPETDTPYHQAARQLQQSVPAEVYLWCAVKHVVKAGCPYNEILKYAGAEEIDLICMGASPWRRLRVPDAFWFERGSSAASSTVSFINRPSHGANGRKLSYVAYRSFGSSGIIRANEPSCN
jgi:nucleotide-binding universal stress UspA family protein